MRTERVIAYIDGFNLYNGLCDAQLDSSRWLRRLLPHCSVGETSNGSSNVRAGTRRYPQALGDTADSQNPTSKALSGTGRHWLARGSGSL